MAQFEVHKNLQDKFPWELRADDDRIIARSPEAYETKRACLRSVAVVKQLAPFPPGWFFEIRRDQQGRFQWQLHLKRDEVFAISPREGYATRRVCREGIDEVRQVAPEALVKDLTQPPTNLPPTASFTVTPEGGEAPLHVFLDASASDDPDGFIVGYEWDFGDGETLETQGSDAEHTYVEPDTYILTLIVTDDVGASDTAGKMIEVSERVVLPAPVGLTATPGDGQVVLSWEVVEGAAAYNLYWSTSENVSKQNGTRIEGVSSPFTHTGLTNGTNYFYVVTAVDAAGGESTESTRASAVPVANVAPTASFTFAPDAQTPLRVLFDASASSDPDGTIATYEWDFGDDRGSAGLSVSHTYPAAGIYTVRLTVTDDEGATDSDTQTLQVSSEALPPDPATVAPELDRTVAIDVATATEFLYTGDNPIQSGVAPGTIEPRRAAVLRGQVLTQEGDPLPGVKISVLGHPKYGSTRSRIDGAFDMVVNGGGQLTVSYDTDNHLPVQQHVTVPWQDYVSLPDVAMMTLDEQVTSIDLSANAEIQVARGSLVSDDDGERQATLLFPEGTSAEMVRPDGSTQALQSLQLRATEFTKGPNGPAAMPSELPPTSGYTYAVEFTTDEALVTGAGEVRFDKPLIHYVENFLDFRVGGIVPVGHYDRERAVWVPSDNGRIIQVLSINAGLAELDIDGSGQAADADDLADLGITEPERRQLANLYQPGESLWRVSIPHFSPWDCNWPYGPPPDATDPEQPPPEGDDDAEDPYEACGSNIEIQNEVLGETVGVTGTPFALHYSSKRVPGRLASYTLEIPVSGPSVPASLRGIELEIHVGGRPEKLDFPPTPEQRTTFTWDGKDAYGRTLQGAHPVKVHIGYVYNAVYQEPAQLEQAFALYGESITGNRARQEVVLSQEHNSFLGPWDTRAQGLAGWSINVHHTYDFLGRVLHMGDGTRRSAKSLGLVITTVAGDGTSGFGGDGGPATDARLSVSGGVAVGPDGSLYITERGNHRLRRVGTDGIITTVAGNGTLGFSGDGGPATDARLSVPDGVAVGPDGSLYILDTGRLELSIGDFQTHRLRRVGTDGIITTVAGNGTSGFSGDGGPATQAQFNSPGGIAVGPDGSLYIEDSSRVRRVGTDGIITTVAGNGTSGFSGDGGPATQAQFTRSRGIAVGPDGSLYIAELNGHRVRRVGTDGIITTVAGNGTSGFSGDGGPATQAQLTNPHGVAVGPDGSLYIADTGAGDFQTHRVRRVGTDGIIMTVAGNGTSGFSGDGGPATQAQLANPHGVAVGPDGSLYIADTRNARIRQVALPGGFTGTFLIPSEDGGEVYVFDGSRHLRTLDALTGELRYQFTYDNGGRLIAITDGDGNATTIERTTNGEPNAIVGPFGQRTQLTLDANGYLDSITNPANETQRYSYSSGGLLTTLTDRRGSSYSFAYDNLGRLFHHEAPEESSFDLARIPTVDGHKVTLLSALLRERTFVVEHKATGEEVRVSSCCGGGNTMEERIGTDGSRTAIAPDGMVTELVQGPDPRWGMQVPLPKSMTVTTPSGLQSTLTTTRTAKLTDPGNPLSLETQSNTVTINGRTYTMTFDTGSKQHTVETPEGRQLTAKLDAQGRVVEEQFPGLHPTTYTYDANGLLTQIAQGGETWRLDYDAQGRLEKITDLTDPLLQSVQFGYDAADQLTKHTLPGGREIPYTYNANGNVTSITPPERDAHSFNYNSLELLEDYTPPDVGAGITQTKYDYNKDGQLTHVARPDGQTIDMEYDSDGRLSLMTLSGTEEVKYEYDPITGNGTRIIGPDGATLSHTFDGSLLTKETWDGDIRGSVGRAYNNDFRVTSTSVNDGNALSYGYDGDGLLVSAGLLTLSRDAQNGLLTSTALGGLTSAQSHDLFGRIKEYSFAHGATEVFRTECVRDDLGRITQKVETIGGQTDTYVYNYDPSERLEGVTKNGVTVAHYGYDPNGNRLSHIDENGTTVSGTYDAQDRLLEYGNTTYEYTANGELKLKTADGQSTTYDYDVLGNLRAATLPNGTQLAYMVDGKNRRVGKRVNATLVQGFLYEGRLSPVAELDGNNSVVSRFVYAARSHVPDYMVKGGVTFRIVTDHIGSPRLVVDVATGQIVQRMDYDEFGNVTLDTNPGFQPFGFAGGLYDRDTKLLRFGARDYDAEVGRWTSKDPVLFEGEDTNLYAYLGNQPTEFADPLGLYPLDPSHPVCKAIMEKIENIRQEIHERTREFFVDKLELPWCVPGDNLKPSLSRKGHLRLINEHKANLAVRLFEYQWKCGGPPPGLPPLVRRPLLHQVRRPALRRDLLEAGLGVAASGGLLWWLAKLASPICGPAMPACAVVF